MLHYNFTRKFGHYKASLFINHCLEVNRLRFYVVHTYCEVASKLASVKKPLNSEVGSSPGSRLQSFEASEARDQFFQDSKTVELFFVSKSEQTNFDFVKKIKILELIFKVKGEKQEEESTAPPCSNRLPLQLAAF